MSTRIWSFATSGAFAASNTIVNASVRYRRPLAMVDRSAASETVRVGVTVTVGVGVIVDADATATLTTSTCGRDAATTPSARSVTVRGGAAGPVRATACVPISE